MAAMSELIEWHRADEVLPDAETDVLVIGPGDAEVWPGYLDGEQWRTPDGFRITAVLFWADMPEGPEQ